MPTPCVILHADLDAFFAAVEQRDRPELRGQPVIVGGPGPTRGVVATASYEARRYGVASAMPMARALRLCPEAIIVPPSLGKYEAAARQVHAIFERYTPEVEPVSIDEAFLDVTLSQPLFGPAAEIARRIQEDVQRECGLTISIGVAGVKSVAKVASDLRKRRARSAPSWRRCLSSGCGAWVRAPAKRSTDGASAPSASWRRCLRRS